MKKKVVSFTIDEKILSDFNKIANSLCINKSKFIEKQIKKFVDSNEKI
jgi:metal-responsive CopG/Arc/MetJ family transcriptional regulator